MDRVIVQSEELKERLLGIRNLGRAHVVPVGFSQKHFYPIEESQRYKIRQSLSVNDNEPLLVYCGVIGKNRNLDRLIETFAIVQKILLNARLMLVGDGSALTEIKDLVYSIGLRNNVIFTGRVPHEEIVYYIGSADIAISYVSINESYTYNPPLKTFEYLACGLPTIATMTESNRKIIQHEFNGVLVSDKPEDISKAILWLLRETEMQSVLKSNARTSITDFAFETITEKKLLPLYENLLAFE